MYTQAHVPVRGPINVKIHIKKHTCLTLKKNMLYIKTHISCQNTHFKSHTLYIKTRFASKHILH